ncbi:MAG: SRPBCC family protein [Balneolaceae bacterium]
MNNRTIHITRNFDAPRKLVFEAFSQPKHIGKWWGPNGFSTTTKKMNFEVGGDWIFTMYGPDGTDYENHIIYTEIVKPELIKYDHYGHRDEEGDPPHFKSTIIFTDVVGKTKVEMNMLFPTSEKRNEAAEFGAIEGGHQTLARLAEFLQETHQQTL